MSVELLTPEDSDFLAYYGKTIASIQEFEFAPIGLARLILRQLSEDIPFESAWNRMEKQFKKADGPLAKPLVKAGHVPREILKELQHFLVGRKNLAHEFLLSYMLGGLTEEELWRIALREDELGEEAEEGNPT